LRQFIRSRSAFDVAWTVRPGIFVSIAARATIFSGNKIPMALHRKIYWVGKQWAVTGSGIQACNQKQRGKFDIEAARLWEDGVLESVRALKWLNPDDFEEAVSVARKYYPEPPRKTPPAPEVTVSGLRDGDSEDIVDKEVVTVANNNVSIELTKESPKPAVRGFDVRSRDLRAKFVPVWRIRFRGR
jgi:hypothetical protein